MQYKSIKDVINNGSKVSVQPGTSGISTCTISPSDTTSDLPEDEPIVVADSIEANIGGDNTFDVDTDLTPSQPSSGGMQRTRSPLGVHLFDVILLPAASASWVATLGTAGQRLVGDRVTRKSRWVVANLKKYFK